MTATGLSDVVKRHRVIRPWRHQHCDWSERSSLAETDESDCDVISPETRLNVIV